MVLVSEILRGIRDTAEAEDPNSDSDPVTREMANAMARAGCLHDMPHSVSSMTQAQDKAAKGSRWTTKLRMHDGTEKVVHLADHFKEHYRDEYTNELLPAEWIREAIHDELD